MPEGYTIKNVESRQHLLVYFSCLCYVVFNDVNIYDLRLYFLLKYVYVPDARISYARTSTDEFVNLLRLNALVNLRGRMY